MKKELSAKTPAQQFGLRRWVSFEVFISVLNSIGTAWIFVLLIIINIDIGGRAIFNQPLQGANEIVSMTIVACVFLQLAHTLKVGRLTRSDILMSLVDVRFPRTAHLVEAVYNLIGAVLMAILLWASLPLFTKAWQIDEFVGSQGGFMAPLWPIKLIILIGVLNAAIQFLILCFASFKKMLTFNDLRKNS